MYSRNNSAKPAKASQGSHCSTGIATGVATGRGRAGLLSMASIAPSGSCVPQAVCDAARSDFEARMGSDTVARPRRIPTGFQRTFVGTLSCSAAPVQTQNRPTDRLVMLRMYLLATAPTAAQRLLRFPAD